MGCQKSTRLLPNNRPLAALLLLIGLASLTPLTLKTQVISPELRRVSVASNQFGIDTLRALDRIEAPDKVLVFCPACLSSSLMMIMMGSSKHQVVSSLRHALYVWSMRPQEINRGYRDIFEHIGFNQNPLQPAASSSSLRSSQAPGSDAQGAESSTYYDFAQATANDSRRYRVKGARPRQKALNLSKYEGISLPALIRFRELMERSLEYERPWWQDVNRWSKDRSSDQLRSDQTEGISVNAPKGQRLGNQGSAVEPSQMNALSSIYIQRGLAMNYNYNLLLRQYYKTVIHPVDFLRNSEETRLHINSLVASSTENKIKDLVKRSTFEARPAPKIMIISTFHFRGTLDIEMKARNKSRPAGGSGRRRRSSSNRPTRDAGGQPRAPLFIETESTPLKFGHFSKLGCSVIEVPFDNRLVTLVIVMPDDRNSTDLLLTRLSAQVLNDMINSLVVKRLSLGIPVIKFDRGPINMTGLLHELDLDDVFHGDRSYSTETGMNRWLRPSDIVHETSIDIGTMNPNWAQPEDRLKLGAHDDRALEANHVKLDKPFFYFVIDSINGLILTMGRIRQ